MKQAILLSISSKAQHAIMQQSPGNLDVTRDISLVRFRCKQRSIQAKIDSKPISASTAAMKEAVVDVKGIAHLASPMTIHALQAVQNNGTLFVHAVLVPSGVSLDPSDPDYDSAAILVKSHCECPSARGCQRGPAVLACLSLWP